MTYIRLIFALVIVALIMGLGLIAYHYKMQATQAVAAVEAVQRDLATAVEVNKQNEATVAKIEADRIKSDKLVTALQDEIDTANQSTLDLATRLSDLRAHNATVNDFLGTPIPDDILRLYVEPKAPSHH